MEDSDRTIYARNGMNREQVGEQVSEQVGEQEMTIPDRPKSRLQKYRLTPLGKAIGLK